MKQAEVVVIMEQRPMSEPVNQLLPIGRFKNREQGIFFIGYFLRAGGREQMQIMIAEYGDSRIAQ